jgi:ankyrin repeat protein
MAASRGDMDPQNQHLKHYNITCGQMIYLLTKHGANPFETDVRDISLIHWAAGSGQLDALQQLIIARDNEGRGHQHRRGHREGVEDAVKMKAERDGATILHWAAAGAKAKEFGSGGHLHVCQYLMDNCGGPKKQKEIVNTLTKDGNSVLMWAAWSGSMEIVKLMIRHRADPLIRNRNGCTVAHWAASAGIVEICEYLYKTINIDFDVKNNAGNSPLSHAVAYGRANVVQWLREEVNIEDGGGEAQDLALDFVGWEEDNSDRKKVLDLFSDWY